MPEAFIPCRSSSTRPNVERRVGAKTYAAVPAILWMLLVRGRLEKLVDVGGIEPPKAFRPPDLQSGFLATERHVHNKARFLRIGL